MLLRDIQWERESEEFHREIATDALLSYGRPTTQRKKAVKQIKFTFLMDWVLYGKFKLTDWGAQKTDSGYLL